MKRKGMLPRDTKGYLMAIFARLFLMVFGIVLFIGVGLAVGNITADANPNGKGLESVHLLVGGLVGGFAGVRAGQWLGNLVVGKPPKD